MGAMDPTAAAISSLIDRSIEILERPAVARLMGLEETLVAITELREIQSWYLGVPPTVPSMN